MCAEAVPWRCHRSLVGDALLVRHVVVEDIMSTRNCSPHKLTKFAQVNDEQILYPPPVTAVADDPVSAPMATLDILAAESALLVS